MEYKIRRLKNADEVANKLMNFKSDVSAWVPCSHKEWIKILANLVRTKTPETDNDIWDVWVAEDGKDQVVSYLAIQLPSTPLEINAVVLYYHPLTGAQETRRAFEIIKKHYKEMGIVAMEIRASNPGIYEKLGFKRTSINMRLEI